MLRCGTRMWSSGEWMMPPMARPLVTSTWTSIPGTRSKKQQQSLSCLYVLFFYILFLYIQGWKVWTCLHDATPARLLRLTGEAPEVCGCHDHQLLQGGRHHFFDQIDFMNNYCSRLQRSQVCWTTRRLRPTSMSLDM